MNLHSFCLIILISSTLRKKYLEFSSFHLTERLLVHYRESTFPSSIAMSPILLAWKRESYCSSTRPRVAMPDRTWQVRFYSDPSAYAFHQPRGYFLMEGTLNVHVLDKESRVSTPKRNVHLCDEPSKTLGLALVCKEIE